MGPGFCIPHREKKDQERKGRYPFTLLKNLCVVILFVQLSLLNQSSDNVNCVRYCYVLPLNSFFTGYVHLFRQKDAVLPAVEIPFTKMKSLSVLTLWYPIQSLLTLSPLSPYFLTLSLPPFSFGVLPLSLCSLTDPLSPIYQYASHTLYHSFLLLSSLII
jgi:hypothetical protein